MARVKVAVLDLRGGAMGITRIVADWFGNGWRTGDTAGVTHWSKTGLSRDDRYPGQRIVPATDEHRRTVRAREWRARLRRDETWDMPVETAGAR